MTRLALEKLLVVSSLVALSALTACGAPAEADVVELAAPAEKEEALLGHLLAPYNLNYGSRNLHLENTLRFKPLAAGADAERGRARFGLAPDLETEDTTEALFEGASVVFGGEVVSNGRTCFTCHRGLSENLGLPKGRLSDSISLDDPLFTGIDADAQGDPDGFYNLNELGLVKYRPNRFNLQRPQSDPFRKVFGWRKSVRLVNTGFMHGFLHDGRGRAMFEVARGAVFSHTQETDNRFDDLFSLKDGQDIEAFLFSDATLSDPRLAALRDENHPLHDGLVEDPYYTVPVTTAAQRRGQKLFDRFCFSCHDMPNVFNNRANVEALGNGDRADDFPPWAPAVGKLFDIGIAKRNKHGLRFTEALGNGQFAPIVLPLVKEDGTVVNWTATHDPGLAATTGRYEDLGRMKVPQLRDLVNNAPYFHDNSANTLEEVVDYFTSLTYNLSKDGRLYPILLTKKQKADLVEFLKVL